MYNLQCRNGTDSLHLETPRVTEILASLFNMGDIVFHIGRLVLSI